MKKESIDDTKIEQHVENTKGNQLMRAKPQRNKGIMKNTTKKGERGHKTRPNNVRLRLRCL